MTYAETQSVMDGYRAKIAALRQEMRALQAGVEPQPVQDYVFATNEGEVRLSQLFGDKRDLIVIHNMGRGCAYCTMWADGFNGVYQHLASRAAFVVATPDAPAVQRRFAGDRGWRFPMVSHQGSSFSADMDYKTDSGQNVPGVSAFRKLEDGSIVRLGDTDLGPRDDFCSVYHLLDLLPEGSDNFSAKFRYADA
jgi:predicted dithiol-disulfide oxidoreductase (DUF899 family)